MLALQVPLLLGCPGVPFPANEIKTESYCSTSRKTFTQAIKGKMSVMLLLCSHSLPHPSALNVDVMPGATVTTLQHWDKKITQAFETPASQSHREHLPVLRDSKPQFQLSKHSPNNWRPMCPSHTLRSGYAFVLSFNKHLLSACCVSSSAGGTGAIAQSQRLTFCFPTAGTRVDNHTQ